MSCIFRDPEDNIVLMCKGADSIIMPLLAQTAENQRLKDETVGHLFDYARVGLRTLMICEKEIDPSWYR